MKFTELDALVVADQMAEAGTLYEAESTRLKREYTAIEQFRWAEHAAKLNIQDAISTIFNAYRNGEGVEPDAVRAFAWLEHGASQKGGERFYLELALAYRDGNGTEVDIPKFWKYMTLAAQVEGGREAMYFLALAHEDPELGELSQRRSLRWTARMADDGAAGAMTKLARHHAQSETGKDRQLALAWAERAVDAARSDVAMVIASKSNPLVKAPRDWVYEDCPDALAAKADILLVLERSQEARNADREAAEAARVAVDLYVAAGEKPSLRLPQLMLREVMHFAPVGAPVSNNATAYVDWLKIVVEAIEMSQAGAFTRLPADLSSAVLSLAHAFKEGAGVGEDQLSYLSWLKKAADWGSSEAAAEYAMHCRPTDPQNFTRYIAKASEAGDNMRAYIYKVVGECLPDSLPFDEVSKLLIDLLEKTEEIRKDKHSIVTTDPAAGIAHYTKPEALKNMLGNQAKQAKNLIRLYNIAYVNDPNEGKRLTHFKRKDDPGYCNPLKPFYREREEGDDVTTSKWQEFSVFLASFSLEPNNLNLWRFYGDDGTGFSVVTPLSAFNTALERGAMGGAWASQDEPSAAWSPLKSRASTITLNQVLYKDSDVEATLSSLEPSLAALDKRLRSINDVAVEDSLRSATVTILSELMYLYKEHDYQDEREVRAVEARPLGSLDVQQHAGDRTSFSRLYLETAAVLFKSKGSSIIIGPKVQKADAVMLDIRHQLATMEWNQCKVEHSLRPYR